MDEKFFAKVFHDNINPILIKRGHDYIKGPFMDMVYMLIEKEKFLLRSSQLKHTSSSKDNHKKSYKRNESNHVTIVEISTNEEEKKPFYKE